MLVFQQTFMILFYLLWHRGVPYFVRSYV